MSAETTTQIIDALIERGFTVLDQIEELGNGRAQPGLPIPGVTYLYRLVNHMLINDDKAIKTSARYENQHQYVSIIGGFNPSKHLETVIEVFHVKPPKKMGPGGLDSHTRMERGFSPTYTMIHRELPLIIADLDQSHPLPPRPKRTTS